MIRAFVLLPLLVLVLVAVPAVVLAATGGDASAPAMTQAGDEAVLQGTVPTPTPRPPISPLPPPHPHPHPRPPAPPPPPLRPTATPVAAKNPMTYKIGAHTLAKVIGDPLSSTIYAYSTDGWLYRSDHDGNGWTLLVTRPFVPNFIMSAANPNVLYSGEGTNCTDASAKPMYRSDDGGMTWAELPAGRGVKPLLIDPSDANKVFAADCTTLYLSTDGGKNWATSPAGGSVWDTYAPVAMASASLVGSATPSQPTWHQLFAIGNNTQGRGVVAYSGDQGATWADISDANKAPIGAKVVVASLREGGKVWVVDSKGVWSSTDYGVTWTFSDDGLRYLARVIPSPFNALT